MANDERLDVIPDKTWGTYTVQQMQDKITREIDHLNENVDATREGEGSSPVARLGNLRERFVQISQVMAMNSLWLDKLVELAELRKKDVEDCEQAATEFTGFVNDLKRIEQINQGTKVSLFETLKKNAGEGSTTQTGGCKTPKGGNIRRSGARAPRVKTIKGRGSLKSRLRSLKRRSRPSRTKSLKKPSKTREAYKNPNSRNVGRPHGEPNASHSLP